MTAYTRYAIYYTPTCGALAQFGAAWLGWDAVAGKACAHPDVGTLPIAVSEITKRPRKYGFHATLKPPFPLAEGVSEGELRLATAELCRLLNKVSLERLEVSRMGRSLVLMPTGHLEDLNHLTSELVQKLDRCRRPPSEEELARRRKPNLSSRHLELLERWGYPYVLDEFRFHMTLSGPLPAKHLDEIEAVLSAAIEPHLPQPFIISDISLVGERPDGMFQLIDTYSLK
jgi:putative phosphonate metabolism protein